MPELSLITVMFLVYVITQRFGEFFLSHSNTKRLRAKETLECGQLLYPYLLCLQLTWLLTLVLAGHIEAINLYWLVCFFVLQIFHFWIMIILGERWTTRLFIFDSPLAESGPFKFFKYPHYILRILDTFVVPMVLGLWQLGLIFSTLLAILLFIRTKEEKKVLAHLS